LYNFAFWWC